MTPATVQHAFAGGGVPVVRYARAPELCGREVCRAFEYSGSAIRVVLAPRSAPDFLVVLFRTPNDARQLARLTHSATRGNALLFLGPASRGRMLKRLFAKIAP